MIHGRPFAMLLAALASMLIPSRAHATDWDDEPACATTPRGCRSRASPDAEPLHTGPTPFTAHRLVFDMHLGVATPYGGIGGALDASIADWLAVEAGAGASSGGAQFAVMPRLRLVVGRAERNAIGFGYGVSVGRHVSGAGGDGLSAPLSALDESPPDTKVWDRAWWSNAELSWERRPVDGGVAVRVYGGVATIRNPDAFRCERYLGYGCGKDQGTSLVYAGVAFGFEL